jgi:hypothetical protein
MLNNGSHLSEDEDDWLIMPLAFLIVIWLLGRTRLKLTLGDDVDWGKALLFMSILFNFVALMCKLVGYAIYAYSGIDYILLDILYLVTHSLSEAVVIGMLLLISYGWTVNFLTGEQLETYTPMAVVMGFLNCVVTIMNKLNDDSHDKYHMYDSLPGGIMVGIRLLTLIIFLIGSVITYRNCVESKQKRVFMIWFVTGGFIYLVSMPILMFVTEVLIREKQQREFLFLIVELTKIISTMLLTHMVTSDRSHYNKINLRNYSFLPSSDKLF